jgi:hypothetical protein
VKYITRTLVACLVAFTALSMAVQPGFKQITLASVGPFPVYLFDALLLASTAAFFYAVALRLPTDPCADNRFVLRLTGIYVLYQALIVVPIAVVFYGVGPGDAYYGVDARLALLLVPFFYYVGLRYIDADRLIQLVNIMASALLLYAVYRYVFIGPQGEWDGGEFRLRVLWGGSTLLFGWLALTGLFLQPRGFRAYALGLAGVLGIALVNHRSGYVALILALACQLLLSRRLTKRVVYIAIHIVLAGLLLATASPTFRESASYSLTTLFNAHADVTAQDRVQRSALAWDYVRVHPLGDYVWMQRYYLVDLGKQGFEPHNFVIQVLDKQGAISGGILFVLIAATLWIGWKNRRASRVSTVMTSYLVFYLVFCLFNTNFDAVENATLFAIGVALVLHANWELVTATRDVDEGQENASLERPRDAMLSPGR